MANEIQLQGRNGDKSFGERADIRAALGNSSLRVAAYPVIRAAARICPFVEAAVKTRSPCRVRRMLPNSICHGMWSNAKTAQVTYFQASFD